MLRIRGRLSSVNVKKALWAMEELGLEYQRVDAGMQFGANNMGDIPLGCHVQLWMRLPIERPQHPHLTAWFNRLCTRPAFKKIVDVPSS
jgi:glutathione S-transferase